MAVHGGVRVVEVEGVARGAVEQRGIAESRAVRGTEDRGAAIRRSIEHRFPQDVAQRLCAARQGAAKPVEQALAGDTPRLRRDVIEVERAQTRNAIEKRRCG